MTTSKHESKNSEASTTAQDVLSTSTAVRNCSGPESNGWLSRSEANKILDKIKEGVMTPLHLINESLKTTGDLT